MKKNMNDKLQLKSGIDKEYKSSFILDRDGLIRISNILNEFSDKLNYPASVVYHVGREDERFYETTDIETVFKDPNLNKKQIIRISIELRDENPNRKSEPWEHDWIVHASFWKNERKPVSIEVFAENRDWALLLADKLEPEVERTLKKKIYSNWILVLFYLFLALVLSLITTSFENLTIISRRTADIALNLFWLTAIGISTLSVFNYYPKKLNSLIRPESVFLWGDQISKYKRREKLRTNIFWGVIVALIVSIISSAITNYLL